MNFSFAGCGFLGIYHVGVAACLKKYAPNLLVDKISGASAGALAAVCLLCDGPLGIITSSVLKTATEARKLFLGPFSPTFNVEKLLRDGLLGMLPDDAHERVNGKLFISVTRVVDGKNVLLSHFESREELIQGLLCSCFIPFISGWIPPSFKGVRYLDGFCSNNLPCLDDKTVTVSPFAGNCDICPKEQDETGFWTALLCSAFIPGFSGWTAPRVKGVRYVDGGFTDNIPELDENTVTISPFCGEADICPKDFNAGLVTISLANTSIELSRENLYRFSLILFPPPPEVLNRMCQQGFNDALEFLQRNNLINCTRCLAVHSTFNMEEKTIKANDDTVLRMDEIDEELHCADCECHRQEAILDTLPEAVGSILQDAINKANKGLMNWVFKHKSMKLVSILTLPYVIPVEVVYATFVKFLSSVPTAKELKTVAMQIIQFSKALIRTWISKPQTLPHHHHARHHHDSNFSCQLAITEFTGEGEAQRSYGEKQRSDFSVEDMPPPYESFVRRDSVILEAEALSHLALKCAVKSLAHDSLNPSRCVSMNPSRSASRAASRAVSRAVSRLPSLEDISITSPDWDDDMSHHVTDDTFEQILNVTNHQDALMAYYYMDDNNEMRVTEIFDMSGATEDYSYSRRSSRDWRRGSTDNYNGESVLQSQLENFKDPS